MLPIDRAKSTPDILLNSYFSPKTAENVLVQLFGDFVGPLVECLWNCQNYRMVFSLSWKSGEVEGQYHGSNEPLLIEFLGSKPSGIILALRVVELTLPRGQLETNLFRVASEDPVVEVIHLGELEHGS